MDEPSKGFASQLRRGTPDKGKQFSSRFVSDTPAFSQVCDSALAGANWRKLMRSIYHYLVCVYYVSDSENHIVNCGSLKMSILDK